MVNSLKPCSSLEANSRSLCPYGNIVARLLQIGLVYTSSGIPVMTLDSQLYYVEVVTGL